MEKVNSSLTKKLRHQILGISLVFILILNSLFVFLMVNEINQRNKTQFIKESELLAQSISESLSDTTTMGSKMMGKGHRTIEKRYNALIQGLSSSSLFLYDLNFNLIGDQAPQHNPSNLFQHGSYHRYQHSLFAYQDQSVQPIYLNQELQYYLLTESKPYTFLSVIGNALPLLLMSSLLSLILMALLIHRLAQKISEPILELTQQTQAFSQGFYNQKNSIQQNDEIGRLAHLINHFGDELQAAKQQQAHIDSQQKEFIASLSHELKTPISIIELTIEKMVQQDPTHQELNQLKNESAHLKTLVNDLMDLTKLEHPEFKLEKTNVNINDILSDVLRSCRHQAAQQAITFNNQIHDVINFHGDYVRLRQMFLIVLDNAIKYSFPHSTITITGNQHEVSIMNQGVGIQPEEMDKIFNRYYRSLTTTQSGSGLGLAIAKEIANRHQIQIKVSSIINQTTQFQFIFPKEKEDISSSNSIRFVDHE